MARPLRSFVPRAIYHVIPRFVGGEWFIRSNEEREVYLKLLGRGLAGSSWSCLAYAIMSSHIHLAMEAGKGKIADWLREPHTQFAEWINQRSDRKGAVFIRGPKAPRIAPDGVARLIGYIHRNPVRAGVVDDPRNTDWTSHRAYTGIAKAPWWLDMERGLDLAGFATPDAMSAWIRETDIDRQQLRDALFKKPRPVGRPRWLSGTPEHVARPPR